jgi:hypothetical protein
MDPPPSVAWAAGIMPEATAAAAPPLDPPVEYSVFQGLRVMPFAMGSVVRVSPRYGVFVLPKINSPASTYFCTILEFFSAI